MSITLFFKGTAKEGKAGEFQDLIAKLVEKAKQYPSCSRVDVFKTHSDPNAFVLIEVWDSIEAHQAFNQQMIDDGTMALAQSLLTEPPKIEYLEAV